MIDDLPGLFAYNRWADDRLIAACRALDPGRYEFVEPQEVGWPSLRSVVAHLAGASHVWARRLRGEEVTALPTEADLPTLDAAARLLDESHDLLAREVLPALSPEQLAGPFTYRNTQGNVYTIPMWTVFRHVVNHATYHRGQAASKLKRLGASPPATDFLYWANSRAQDAE